PETHVQIHHPRRHRLRRVFQFALLLLLGTGHHQFPVVLLIGPVDGHKRGPFRLARCRYYRSFLRHSLLSFSIDLTSGQTWLPRKAYSGVWNQTASENSSLEPSASRGSTGAQRQCAAAVWS